MITLILRPHWPSVLFWGLGFVSSSAVLAGMTTGSWSHAGTTALALSVLYAALMLAIAQIGALEV